jgi:EAL domain-containing protein (putative c-di-GMP-specific phosphodiesterase class I)
VLVDERELVVSASIGICLYPQDGDDPLELVKNADAAMYRAKAAGGNGYELFAPAMNAEALDRLALEGELRQALSAGQIEVHYQPIVAVETGALHGCEALVRWRHPERGLLQPDAVLAVAETSGLIVRLGHLVLRAATEQAARWVRAGSTLHMSVNLSARQLRDPDLVRTVRDLLAEAGLDPERLELEVTEAAALQNEEQTAMTLAALRTLGVKVALDDFGTGYSSLSHLSRLPIDCVKIDRSLIGAVAGGRQDAAIATAIINRASSLGLEVTAEGVETQAQLERLRELRCGRVQGYLLGRALPASDVDVGRQGWLTNASASE